MTVAILAVPRSGSGGKGEYWDIINIQATDAMRGAILNAVERLTKQKVESLLMEEKG